MDFFLCFALFLELQLHLIQITGTNIYHICFMNMLYSYMVINYNHVNYAIIGALIGFFYVHEFSLTCLLFYF